MASYDYLKDKNLRERLKTVRKNRPEANSAYTNSKKNNLSSSQSTSNPNRVNKQPAPQEKTRSINTGTTPSRKRYPKPSTKDLAISTKQLASMIRTGLPLLEALNIISSSSDNKSLKSIYKEISIGISKGTTLLENLSLYPNIFDEMYLALVSAGEAAGKLPEVLDRESKLLESLAKIKGQIRSAMAYPIGISVITFVVVIIMLVYVMPVFVEMYSKSGADLPGLTQFLVDASTIITDPMFLAKLLPISIISFFVIRILSRQEPVLLWKDRLFLKIPVVSGLVTKSSLANFSRTLSSLNDAGVPILEALQISKRTLSNRVFKNVITKMYYEIESGQPIHKALERDKIIPVMFTSMFRIGEETGELSEMVNKLADFYEDEVSESVKALTSIMEPLMIVFVAGVVAVMLIAMYLPMFFMFETIQ
ncbi:type II secretion system F family protein [Synechococcus sp. MU1648]|nr:type II secretion system F family protein [Synechococcus sp. MU1648]